MTRADILLVASLIGMALLIGWAVVARGAEPGTAEERDPPIGWCACPR